MSATKNLRDQSPVEIDGQLFDLLQQAYRAEDDRDRAMYFLHSAVGDTKVYGWARGQRQGVWQLTDAEVIDKADDSADPKTVKCFAEYQQHTQAMEAAWLAMIPFEEEYTRRGRWTRAYLVDNADGHLHTSRMCSTCFPTTRFHWFTELSGKDESEIVELAGEKACTVCYPTAPVDLLKRPSRLEGPNMKSAREEREARDKVKAERAAKKAEKAIANPDGSPLKAGFSHDTIATVVTAWNTVVSNLYHHRHFGYDEHAGDNALIIAALAHKLNVSPEEITKQVDAKVAAKAKKVGGEHGLSARLGQARNGTDGLGQSI